MNTTSAINQIAKHLQVSVSQITKLEEWANCYFVVIQGRGGRFVSKKVVVEVKATPTAKAYEVELSKLCRKVRKANHTLAGRRARAMFC